MYGRVEGTADHYWPWAVFFKILLFILSPPSFIHSFWPFIHSLSPAIHSFYLFIHSLFTLHLFTCPCSFFLSFFYSLSLNYLLICSCLFSLFLLLILSYPNSFSPFPSFTLSLLTYLLSLHLFALRPLPPHLLLLTPSSTLSPFTDLHSPLSHSLTCLI